MRSRRECRRLLESPSFVARVMSNAARAGIPVFELTQPPRCPEDRHDWHYNQLLGVVCCTVCYRDYTGWLVDRVAALEAQVAELQATLAKRER